MNKKKSKALAFLLAASLLVPSANGIVSAAELRGNEVATVEQAEGTGEDSTTDEGATEESAKTITIDSVDKLKSINDTISKAAEGSTIVIATNVSGTEIENPINISKKNIKICGENKITENGDKLIGVTLKGAKIFDIQASGVTISNLILENTVENKSDKNGPKNVIIGIKDSLEDKTTIEDCYFTGKPIWNLISCPKKSKLVFNKNNVNLVARAMIVGVTNGSKITYNTINLQKEKFDENNRTGVLSVTAIENGEGVTIENNTFENANRAIGVDHSSLEGEKLTVKNNNFINTKFAFEIDTRTKTDDEKKKPLNNIGKKYDLSKNYYKYGNNPASAPKVQDANSHEEVKEDDNVPLDFVVGPYYTTEDKKENEMNNAGVATVAGKDYPTLAKAIEAAQSGQTVTIHKDVELTKSNGILVDKNITINSTNNAKLILNGEYTLGVTGSGHLTLSGMTIELKKPEVNYLRNQGATLEIVGCKIAPSVGVKDFQTKSNLIADNKSTTESERAKGRIILRENEITLHARVLVSSVGNGSVIERNIIDLCGEKFIYSDTKKVDRTGILSIIADENGTVRIEENTFKNANRAIGLDHSTMLGENLTIKKNVFENVRFGAEIDPVKKNKDKKYDFSGNYFYHKEAGGVGPMKIQDASRDEDDAQGNPIYNKFSYRNTDGQSVEIKFDEYTDQNLSENINQWPYYTDSKLEHLSNEPGKPIKPVYDHTSIIGKDRYDTAAKIADKLGSYDNVVLVNATSTMSDGLSASGLAGKEKGAILLTKKDSIPKVTMDRLKKVKKVYIIGGENAISAKVANEITAAGIKVERIGGKTRVETSELVAKKLGNYKKAFVVNGFKGEADAMSASSVAAKNGAPILLTNGKTSTHAKKSGVKYYVVGGNNVVNKSIANKYNAEVLAGDDRYETNREVINEFYGESETLYFANGETLVDALTASTLSKDDGLVLVGRKSDNKILNKKNTIQVGGIKFDVDFIK